MLFELSHKNRKSFLPNFAATMETLRRIYLAMANHAVRLTLTFTHNILLDKLLSPFDFLQKVNANLKATEMQMLFSTVPTTVILQDRPNMRLQLWKHNRWVMKKVTLVLFSSPDTRFSLSLIKTEASNKNISRQEHISPFIGHI